MATTVFFFLKLINFPIINYLEKNPKFSHAPLQFPKWPFMEILGKICWLLLVRAFTTDFDSWDVRLSLSDSGERRSPTIGREKRKVLKQKKTRTVPQSRSDNMRIHLHLLLLLNISQFSLCGKNGSKFHFLTNKSRLFLFLAARQYIETNN